MEEIVRVSAKTAEERAQLVELVKEEATKLRELLTPEERSKFTFESFSPLSFEQCIYGLATGHCFTPRAAELIEACCERVYENNGDDLEYSPLNGSPKGLERDMYGENKYWSPIEVYIALNSEEEEAFYDDREEGNEWDHIPPQAQENAKLLKFLKGETDILDIK